MAQGSGNRTFRSSTSARDCLCDPSKTEWSPWSIIMNLQTNFQVMLQGTKPVWCCHSLRSPWLCSRVPLHQAGIPPVDSGSGHDKRCLRPKVISEHAQRALSRYQRCIVGNTFVFHSLKFTIKLCSQHLKSRIFFTSSPRVGGKFWSELRQENNSLKHHLKQEVWTHWNSIICLSNSWNNGKLCMVMQAGRNIPGRCCPYCHPCSPTPALDTIIPTIVPSRWSQQEKMAMLHL